MLSLIVTVIFIWVVLVPLAILVLAVNGKRQGNTVDGDEEVEHDVSRGR